VDGMAPTFATKPTIRQDEDGSTLIFHCAIMADPTPAITWYHNGVKVHDNDKFQVRKQKGLFIQNTISCRATPSDTVRIGPYFGRMVSYDAARHEMGCSCEQTLTFILK
jgi:hypothetical protein